MGGVPCHRARGPRRVGCAPSRDRCAQLPPRGAVDRGGLEVRRHGAPLSVTDLIDTTEMYLRTIYELREDGVVPMRARIAEHLDHAGPTVSQTIARMERGGLVTVDRADRHLE